jgi:hypothetical protein
VTWSVGHPVRRHAAMTLTCTMNGRTLGFSTYEGSSMSRQLRIRHLCRLGRKESLRSSHRSANRAANGPRPGPQRALQRTKRATLCGLATLLTLMMPPTESSYADNGFHGYSAAYELSLSGQYTGVQTTRIDQYIFSQPATGCTQNFAGDPVFQSEWILITPDAANWLEIGTGHQCNDQYRYWFSGYGYLGVWVPVAIQVGVVNGQSHAFTIGKQGSTYYFHRDFTSMGSQQSSFGSSVSSGLESYASAAIVGTYSHSNLQYIRGTTYYPWAGFDDSVVDAAQMCGGWNSQTSWRVAEWQSC